MEFTCYTCQKIFRRKYEYGTGNKYCSNECRHLRPKIIREHNCEHCGKSFIQERKRNKCCSLMCAGLNRFPDHIARFWGRVLKPRDNDACWIWTGKIRNGYGKFAFKINGERRYVTAHRFSWELTNGPIPNGLFVCHKCDNPPCLNPLHLFLADALENMKDRDRKGRQARGEKGGTAKLTEEKVGQIRKKIANKEKIRDIVKEFNISSSSVYAIGYRRTWKHVL